MFVPDWSPADPENLAAEAWTLVVANRELCFPSDDPDNPLIPLGDLDSKLYAGGIIRLGIFRERPLYIFECDDAPLDMETVDFRDALMRLESEVTRAAMLGYHILIWLKNSRYCGRCGVRNEFHQHEKARRCPACGMVVFPRISPAVITAVLKDGKLLLAYNKRFSVPVYSLLAGFVEPGETLEETVAREIREEVGIEVQNIRYLSSQPWPFPDSLMLGFLADWHSREIEPDGIEITDAGWYGPDNLPRLPRKGSIALRIIESLLPELR